MALPLAHRWHRLGSPGAPIVLEVFWDLCCPFSAKSFRTFTKELVPWLEEEHKGMAQVIFRQQVQAWHPQATMMHEAALAVEAVNGAKFWDYCAALFDEQEAFFDPACEDLSRKECYARLADIATNVGVSKEAVLEKLKITGNGGNAVTPLIKYFIKYTRLTGVHVSPTVLIGGLVDNAPSSSWTLDQWKRHLKPYQS